MSRYFFDVDDDCRHVHDDVGKDLINFEMAEIEANVLLRSLGSIRQMQGRSGTTYVSVRDLNGRKVHHVSTHVN